MDFALQLATPPANEPIVLADMKKFLRVDDDDLTQDAVISSLITAARVYVEQYTGLQLCTATWNLLLDNFMGLSLERFIGQMPPWAALSLRRLPQVLGSSGLVISRQIIYLPRPPLASIVSINYLDPNTQVTTLLASTLYTVDTVSIPGRIMPAWGQVWPVTWEVMNAVTIQFTAGYSADGTSVPASLITALKLLIAHWYEHREAAGPDAMTAPPFAVESLLQSADYWNYR